MFTTDANGVTHQQDDHGAGRRLRWQRRTRARAIAYLHEPGQASLGTSPLKRLKSCGLAKAPDVIIKVHNRHAFASGLMSCGNIWTCPTCSARIRARREIEFEQALTTHCQGGGQIGMLTLTLRHSATDPLSATLDTLNDAWRRLQQRRQYRPLHDATTGTIATVEITHGDNGWHPHLHILLLAGPDTSRLGIIDATNGLREAWSYLANTHPNKFTLEHGLNLTWFGRNSAAAARYTTKLAKEMTLSDTKSGHDPFSLLDEPTPRNTALFIEYALATYRRQCHRWSAGLRDALAMKPAQSDEELADANDDVGVEVLVISRPQWNHLSETERLGWLEWAECYHNINGP